MNLEPGDLPGGQCRRHLEEREKTLPGLLKTFSNTRYYSLSGAGAPAVIAAALLASCVLSISPATAQEDGSVASGDTAGFEIELDTVIVIGERVKSGREAENPSKFMTVIDVSESSRRMDSVSEVLSETVGVEVKSWGGLGSFSTASVRGASAGQVEVFLDGVPLNRAVTGVTNLEDLPLDNIEYIEVFRGFTPADFGTSGIGGAINLVTSREIKGYRVSGTYGSWSTVKVSAAGAGRAGPAKVLAFAGYASSRGDFEYENDNGTPLNENDDFTDTRVNNDFVSGDLTARVSGYAGEWELAATGTGHVKEQGLPGVQSAQAERTRLETGRGTMVISAENRRLLDGRLSLLFTGDGLFEVQVLRDAEGELGTGGSRETENRMSTVGGSGKAVWIAKSGRAALTAFVQAREESFAPADLLPEREEGKEQGRILLAGVFSAELADPSEVFTIQLTVRHERYWNEIEGDPNFAWSKAAGDNKDRQDLTSPSVGVRVRIGRDWTLKGNAGRFYRAPTFYELFGDRGIAIGNTDLEPEVGVNWDAGFSYHGSRLGPLSRPYLEYAFFQSRMEDLILFFQNSQRTIMAMNSGGALITGHEVSFGARLFESWSLSGNYTFQSAVDRGDVPFWRNNALPFRPMHQAYGRVGFEPGERFEAWGEATYISGNYWDRANLFEVPDRRIYNLGASVEIYRKGRLSTGLTLEVKNLADERVADVAGYPLPGRSLYGTLEARWR